MSPSTRTNPPRSAKTKSQYASGLPSVAAPDVSATYFPGTPSENGLHKLTDRLNLQAYPSAIFAQADDLIAACLLSSKHNLRSWRSLKVAAALTDPDAPATTTTQVDLEGVKVYRRAASTISPITDGATPLMAGLIDRIVNELLLNPLFQVQDHDWIGVLKQ